MLRPSISHADFLQRLDSALCGLDSSQTLRLNSDEFRLALHKVRAINLDPAVPIVSSLYSTRGRPAADPTLILCSLILMFHFGETSIQKWHDRLEHDVLLKTLCGYTHRIHAVNTYYSLIDRLYQWAIPDSILPAEKNRRPEKKKKPKGKRGRKPKNSADETNREAPVDQSGSPEPTRKGEKLNLNPPGLPPPWRSRLVRVKSI